MPAGLVVTKLESSGKTEDVIKRIIFSHGKLFMKTPPNRPSTALVYGKWKAGIVAGHDGIHGNNETTVWKDQG